MSDKTSDNNIEDKVPLEWEVNFDHSRSEELVQRYYSGEITYEEFRELLYQR